MRFPEIRLEIVEALSSSGEGFLRLVRRRLRAHYPDGTSSAPFAYDEVDRSAIDAVILCVHFLDASGERHVFLRSAVRPPVAFRAAERSPRPSIDPPNGYLWELPAGLVETSEQSEEGLRRAAQREIREELGFTVALEALSELGPSVFPVPAFIAERHFFFEVAVDPSARTEPSLDGSALEHGGAVVALSAVDALARCRSGEFQDSKTELCLRRLVERYPGRGDMSAPRVVVVAKRTAYQRFVEDERDPRAKLLIRRRAPVVGNWLEAHREHSRTLEHVERRLERLGVKVMLVRRAHAAFDASDAALVIAVGGDGTLLAASHSVSQTPILGVNSAPRHSVGFFCALSRATFDRGLAQALEGKIPSVELTRMSVLVNGRVRSNRVLNDALYAHSSPAATSRYIIEYRRAREEQRSSGFWIGPAAGSTAAQRSAGGSILPLGSGKLQLVVREPYVPSGKRNRLVHVLVNSRESIRVESKMDDACVFIDGPYRQVPVRLGDVLAFRASDEPLLLFGMRERRRG